MATYKELVEMHKAELEKGREEIRQAEENGFKAGERIGKALL